MSCLSLNKRVFSESLPLFPESFRATGTFPLKCTKINKDLPSEHMLVLATKDAWIGRLEELLITTSNLQDRSKIEDAKRLIEVLSPTDFTLGDIEHYALCDLAGRLQALAATDTSEGDFEIDLMVSAPWNLTSGNPEKTKAGSALVRALGIVAKTQGYKTLKVDATKSSAGFYEKLGFVAKLDKDSEEYHELELASFFRASVRN